jgi:hypothetical protein
MLLRCDVGSSFESSYTAYKIPLYVEQGWWIFLIGIFPLERQTRGTLTLPPQIARHRDPLPEAPGRKVARNSFLERHLDVR